MKTKVCEMLGTEFPLLAFSHCRDVVAEVSRAGGFGVLGAVAHSPEQLEVDLTWIEEQVGDKPYGLDLLFPAKFEGSEGGERLSRDDIKALFPPEHLEFLDEMLERYDVPPLPANGSVSGRRMSSGEGLNVSVGGTRPLLDVAFSHDIKLIASALGPPPPGLIEEAHSHDVVVAALAGKAVHAERHARQGVDLIVAQGSEAGGHTGTIGTMVLVPEIVDAVAPIPVLAAGGIGRGRQMAASLALGAEGVWCGSVWLTTAEAETPDVVKEKFLTATSADTVRSRSLTGKPARMLRTAWTDEWERSDTPDPLGMPLQTALVSKAQARIHRSAHHEGSGAGELANYFVGQVVGTMDKIKPTRQVVYELIEELVEAEDRLHGMLMESS